MSHLTILTAPDPLLKKAAMPVDAVDEDIRRLMDDMLKTMYAAPGIGLAAPQVGVSKRVIVTDLARAGDPADPVCMANPEFVFLSDDEVSREEGCLSFPEHYANVVRPANIQVRYLDRNGEIREREASGLESACIQHEMDHLDGILFVDHISAIKRNIILRKLAKARKAAVG